MAMGTDGIHRLSWEQALAWRMNRHHLVGRAASADLIRVVGDICGLHAQLTSSPELSLWARIDSLQRDAVHEALWTHRALVKLWAMRGTLHLLPSAELGMWLAAFGTYTKFGNTGRPEIDVLSEAVGRVLEGRVLTREELALAVEKKTGSPEFGEWVRLSWGSYLKAASFRGLICFAPSEDSNVRFTSPTTWAPDSIDKPESTNALRNITRRFLGAYAPLTAEELARWWVGPPVPRLGNRMLAALGEEVVNVEIEGHRAWMLARDVSEMERMETTNVARLLPAFDPWVIGAPRGIQAILEPHHEARIYRKQGWFSPVVLVNGQIAGVWKHTRKGRRLHVEIDPFDPLPAWAHTQVEAETERLAAFLDADPKLSWQHPASDWTAPQSANHGEGQLLQVRRETNRQTEEWEMGRGRTFSRAFTLAVVRQVVVEEQRPAQVCREHGLAEGLLLRWRREDAEQGEAALTPSEVTTTAALERQVAELERCCGQLAVENAALTREWAALPSRSGTR